MHCNVWCDKNLCGTNLCDQRLTCINRSYAKTCHFRVPQLKACILIRIDYWTKHRVWYHKIWIVFKHCSECTRIEFGYVNNVCKFPKKIIRPSVGWNSVTPGPTYDIQLMHNGAHISTMGADGRCSGNNLQWLATIPVATLELDLIANRKETNQYYLQVLTSTWCSGVLFLAIYLWLPHGRGSHGHDM